MKFAFFTGSTPEWTPEIAAAKAAEQGWDGLEWRIQDQLPSEIPDFFAGNLATYPMTGVEPLIPDIIAVTRNAGLEHAAVLARVPIGERDGVERVLEVTAALGAGQVRLSMPAPDEDRDYSELFAQARRDTEFATEKARDLGVKGLIQIHHGTITPTASAVRRLIEGLDPRAIGVIHDLGHSVIEGREGLESPRMAFQILGEYLAHVHVKNAVWQVSGTEEDGTVDWEWAWAPLRKGIGDVKGYFRALASVGYDGWVTVEDFTRERPLEERLADDLSYTKSAARDAGYPV